MLNLHNMALSPEQKQQILADPNFQTLVGGVQKPIVEPISSSTVPVLSFRERATQLRGQQITPVDERTPVIEDKPFFEPIADKVRGRDVLREGVNLLIDSEKKFGETLAGGITTGEGISGKLLRFFGGGLGKKARKEFLEAEASQTGLDKMTQKLSDAIIQGKIDGKDTERLEKQYEVNVGKRLELKDIIGETASKSAKQIFGEGLGVVADIAAFGKYGKTLKPNQFKTGFEAFVAGAKKFASEGAALGGSFATAEALKADKPVGEVIKAGAIGVATGGIISGILGGISTKGQFGKSQKSINLREKAIEQYERGLNATKERFKEKSAKIIPDLLDKGWWGTRKNLLRKAEKNLALSGEEYRKLGELKGVIEIDGLINLIDDEIAGFTLTSGRVSSVNQTRVKALSELKLDVLAVDAFDKIKDNKASQQSLRELAQGYGKEVFETRKAQKTIMDNKTLSQVKKVDGAIRDLLGKDPRNVTYAKINEVYHLNSELAGILNETAIRTKGNKFLNLIRSLSFGGGAVTGAVVGGAPGVVVGGLSLGIAAEILNSAWWNTLRAVQKSRLADKLAQQSGQQLSQSLLLLLRQGIKGVNQLLNE